jgi:hypothetical protein
METKERDVRLQVGSVKQEQEIKTKMVISMIQFQVAEYVWTSLYLQGWCLPGWGSSKGSSNRRGPSRHR